MTRALLALHQWAGLAAAVFLFVLGATGSALVFENGIDRALNRSLFAVRPQGAPLPLSTLVARADAAQPADPIAGIRLADAPDQAYEFSSRVRRSITIDPYTGRILGTRDREKSFARWLHLLHTRFVAGEKGELAAGLASVVMVVLAVSGLVLWWPRRIFSVLTTGSWKRTNFDLHNTLGFYSSAVMLVIALSAVLIAFERTTDPIVRRLDAGAAPPDVAALRSASDAGPAIAPEAAVAIAERTLPGAVVSNVGLPAGPRGIYRLLLKFPEDRTPAGRSRVYVDQHTGGVLAVENTRTAPPGTRLLNLKRSLHTGDIFGAPTQALYFLISLAIPAQVLSGVLIFLQRRRR